MRQLRLLSPTLDDLATWTRDDYCTPEHIVAPGRRALGGDFDLDPFSNVWASEFDVVRAHQSYTRADDGLTSPWDLETLRGSAYGELGRRTRVWANPWYSGPGEAVELVAEMDADEVATSLLLVRHDPTTRWWKRHAKWRRAAVLINERVQFLVPDVIPKTRRGNSSLLSTLMYFGPAIGLPAFCMAYSHLGDVVVDASRLDY